MSNEATPRLATSFTKKLHEHVYNELNFENKQDYEEAKKGFIAPLETKVFNDEGDIAWDIEQMKFIEQDPAPETVNPSLWRNGQLQTITGLFEVVEGVYQVRGQGLAYTILIEGKTGVIVCDTQSTIESAKAVMQLYYKHRPKKPVSAIIISQSHIDHYGGIHGILHYAENANIPIIAPENFTKETMSEQVLLGIIMSRRAQYQAGAMLPIGPTGQINAGIGLDVGSGTISFKAPTNEIHEKFLKTEIDGITFQFQLALNTEAPSEMHFYVHDYKVMFASENANRTMHQIYTLRGAKPRDTLAWVNALDTTIDFCKKVELEALIMIHAWPAFGKENALYHLKMQRDMYKYMHDQTVRLANHGYTMDEIAEAMQLPPTLNTYWGNRGYYGTLKHNVKAIYNFYLGYYSGNPSDLDPLPQVESAQKYVQYIGGASKVIEQARVDYEKGEYRWVAQILKHVVMSEPDHEEAKQLLADAFEQLGFQAESAIWRNVYLSGAHELRHGVKSETKNTSKMLNDVPVDDFFKLLAIKLNGPKAEGISVTINVTFTDMNETYTLYVENSVLTYKANVAADQPDTALIIDKVAFYKIGTGQLTPEQALADGQLSLSGESAKLNEFLELLDTFDIMSNIVTP
ncbi:alkyl/aryl-sulfatase [Paenibacillus arenosi]|uniref:MBL fold metallo-hydrolase n=1 Tax=Paenibacillus arenosi TaxID=2774142 RepID=A0ABR9B295_9BACL|nr:alkyl sulfatase dimerization domain-containing protein [Paenibacillus arenosi]MBD8499565.1 MBL fold metallo-hydrolase [Paenibacillus arenosi]